MKELFVKPERGETKNYFTLYRDAWNIHKTWLTPNGIRAEQEESASVATQAISLAYAETDMSKFAEELAEEILADLLPGRRKERDGSIKKEELLRLYKDLYTDIFRCHRKWCDMEGTDEDWGLLVNECSDLVGKYGQKEAGGFVRDLTMTVLGEIERIDRLRHPAEALSD